MGLILLAALLMVPEIIVTAPGSFTPRYKNRRTEREKKQCLICSCLMDNIFCKVSIYLFSNINMMGCMSKGIKMLDEKSSEDVKEDGTLFCLRGMLISHSWMKYVRGGVGCETENT